MTVPPHSRQHSRNVMMGLKMTKKNGSNSGEEGVGYGRPPKSGQIKPGEVRNPWGKTGKPRLTEDVLLKIASELVPASINGRATMISQEEAFWRKVFQEIHKGKIAAARLTAESLERRRPPLPPIPAATDIAEQEAERARREELSKTIIGALDSLAAIRGGGK